MKLFMKLKMARAFIALIKDPNQTERIFEIGEMARKRMGKDAPEALQDVLQSSAFQALYQEHYNPRIDLNALRKLPPETFGGSVARFLDLNGFEPNAFPLVGDRTPVEYLVSRLRQTHDLWHVLTGYGTGVKSELALQAFMIPQIGAMVSGLIISGGLLHTIFYKPMELKATFDLIAEGYQRGKQASPLLFVKWEELWSEDLESVRARFGLNQADHHGSLFLNGQEDFRMRAI